MTPDRWQQVKGVLENVLELAPSERAVFLEQACNADHTLRQEVESLLAIDDELTAEKKLGPALLSDATVVVSAAAGLPHEGEPWIGRWVGPYKIVEQIGIGGMGEVYRAVRDDEQYRKQVAIKVVRAGQDSALVVSRFKNERQILANLDHPNIARLLDGGTTKEGAAYFVMELIDGEPVDQYCNHHKLAVTERLKLFLQICSAVQYAHQRLIIHRDIKPGNILVTSDGVPKLLDFGIAKLLDVAEAGQAEPTLTIFRVLTPAYASPEQVKGEPITTASDVYSLGVVLYELLTGNSPYHITSHTPHEMVRAVCEFEPERPSTALLRRATESQHGSAQRTQAPADGAHDGSLQKLSKRLSGDLDNIVLMALRKEPQRRYASVEQFAEDIRRHLENLPVIARKDTIRYRTSKFVSRHKAGVLAVALVSLALITGLAVTLREARIARAERARAEGRFSDVRSLANSLIFEIHDSVKDLPGSTASRKLIVEKALKYLDGLARESAADPALQRELASAYVRIGNVQGGTNETNLGDTSGSLESYRKALEIRKALYAANPNRLKNIQELSESYRNVADTQAESGQTANALESIRRARQLAEQAEPSHPEDADLLRELASDYEIEAGLLGGSFSRTTLGDSSGALAARRKELEISERLGKLRPNDRSTQSYVAVSVTQMGDQLILGGQWRESVDYYLRAKVVFERLAAQSPGARDMMDYLQGTYQRLHFLELQDGNVAQATLMARKAVQIAEKSSQTDPNDVWARANLANDYSDLAAALTKTPDKREAIPAIERALSTMKDVVTRDPQNKEMLGEQAATFTTAGDVYRSVADYSQALDYYRRAAAVNKRMVAEDPQNVASRLRLAANENSVAAALLLLRDTQGATDLYNQALALAHAEATSTPANEQALYSTADAYTGLGDVESKLARTNASPSSALSHWKKACTSYEESFKVWSSIKEPGRISPEGFASVPRSAVSARLAKCQSAVASVQPAVKK